MKLRLAVAAFACLAFAPAALAGGDGPPPPCVDTDPSPYHSTCPVLPPPDHGQCPEGSEVVVIVINEWHSRTECRPVEDECNYERRLAWLSR